VFYQKSVTLTLIMENCPEVSAKRVAEVMHIL
jgi:hypothetical protein